MFRFLAKLIGFLTLSALAAAGLAKLFLESRADPDTEELDMVSVFEGRRLVSTANPFYGGRIMAMFSGVTLDLRQVTPAPTGVHLDLAVCCSGVQVIVPVGWKIRSEARIVVSGFTDASVTDADPDAPTLHISGIMVASGVQVIGKPAMEVVR